MKLSVGAEFLITQQGIQPPREEAIGTFVPMDNPAPEMDEHGPRVIQLGDVKVVVLPRRKRG